MHGYRNPQPTLTPGENARIFLDLKNILFGFQQRIEDEERLSRYLDRQAKQLCGGLTLQQLPNHKDPYGLNDVKRDYAAEFLLELDDRRKSNTNKDAQGRHFFRDDYIGYHPDIAWARRQVSLCFRSRPPSALLIGERGVGKGQLVTAAHNHYSSGKKIYRVAMGTLSEELAASELFGHAKGAFTGANTERTGIIEKASKTAATVYLDDFQETPPTVQGKMLTWLEEGWITKVGALDVPIDVGGRHNRRFPLICAAQPKRLANIRSQVYDRIANMVIRIPPLRRRGPDVAFLALRFAQQAIERTDDGKGKSETEITPEVCTKLFQQPWDGNVRELDGTVAKVILNRELLGREIGGVIREEEIVNVMQHQHRGVRREEGLAGLGRTLREWLSEYGERKGMPTFKELGGAYGSALKDLGKSDGEVRKILGIKTKQTVDGYVNQWNQRKR